MTEITSSPPPGGARADVAARPEHGGRIAAMLSAMDELSSGLDDLANTLRTMEQYDGLLEQLKALRCQTAAAGSVQAPRTSPVTSGTTPKEPAPGPTPAARQTGPRDDTARNRDPAQAAAWTGAKRDSRAPAAVPAPKPETGRRRSYVEAGLTLVRAMDKRAVSVPVLAKRSGMSATTLRKLLQGDATVTVPFYYKAAIELGCLRRVQELLPENGTADGPNTKGGNGGLG